MIIDRFSPARRISCRRTHMRMLSVAACVVLASAARAQVTSYTNLAAFQSAAPSTVLRATFESFPVGQVNDIAEGGLSFSNNGGGPLYILDPGLGGTSPAPLSKILTGNGNERFDITLAVQTPSRSVSTLTPISVYRPTSLSSTCPIRLSGRLRCHRDRTHLAFSV